MYVCEKLQKWRKEKPSSAISQQQLPPANVLANSLEFIEKTPRNCNQKAKTQKQVKQAVRISDEEIEILKYLDINI